MSTEYIQRKADGSLYNASSENFIPVACHYDENTLLTKNGELVQTIQINGINSEKISKQLVNLRDMVRKAIKENIGGGSNFAFWIHTIRRKANLDDNTPYNSLLSANIHDIWRKKNYWHDKFVNRLYISIVHDAPELKVKNLDSLLNSLSPYRISNFEENYFKKAAEKLNSSVNSILESLEEYGAEKLGIRFEENGCYSDPMFLYRRIMQLNENGCLVPITDISSALASHSYAVGSDKIEVIGAQGKKFAAMISIKEYQEVASEALDSFLQIPIEMVATEVFYFIDRKQVVSVYEDQNYILSVSGDAEMQKIKGIDKITDNTDDNPNKFCSQQISFMVIADDLQQLDKKVYQASETLSKIGIVHVREDINLEKTFWAQLPANFSFLSRMSPTILDNTAALASLHNFPTGNQYNPWGRAVTLLRTEKGTPYFMNFHDQDGNGNTCILGANKSGRTTLLNFFISEADKYKPTILYFTDDMDSGLFIKAKEGSWFQRSKELVNPLLCEDSRESRDYMFEFFKIISHHDFDPLSETDLTSLRELSDKVFSFPLNERKLSNVIKLLDPDESKKSLNKRLEVYLEGGAYYKVFERETSLEINEGSIVAFNLNPFDDTAFTKANYPKEKKFIEQFMYDLNILRGVKVAAVFAIQFLLRNVGTGPKILVIDNIAEVINLEYFSSIIPKILENVANINGVFISTVSIDELQKLYTQEIKQGWIDLMNTKFILPPDFKTAILDKVLSLDPVEFRKLSSLTSASRMFLISQDMKTIAAELSIGGLYGLIGILSSSKTERNIYKEVIKEYGDKVENWVQPFYDELESTL